MKKFFSVKKILLLGVIACTVNGAQIAEAKTSDMALKVSSIEYTVTGNVNEEEIKRLLPELERKEVRVGHLSKNIQIINESGSMQLKAQFQPEADGTYHVIVIAEDKKDESVSIAINNTGNKYTGRLRAGITFTDTDVAKAADTVSVSYITSPGHFNDVHQVSLFYKFLVPKLGDSAYINYSYSDADMGSIAKIYDLDLYSYGESQNVGIHYQHNLKYTSAGKQILDFGLDYKKNKGNQKLKYGDAIWSYGAYDVEDKLFSVTYSDMRRQKRDVLSYNVGYVHGFDGDKASFDKYRANSDANFNVIRAGVNYQYRTNKDWIINARLNGQFTNNSLLGMEQLGAGGMNSVRGFSESVASGDKGYVGNMEIYSPEIAPKQRLVVFSDFARLLNNHYNIGEASKNLASVGVGYRLFNWKGVSLSLDYALPVSGKGVSHQAYQPWHLNIVKWF